VSPLGLYLHIPFCESICGYCAFTRGILDDDLKTRYVGALEREIRRAGSASGPEAADTVYFGGGTPSLLDPGDVERLVAACRDAFNVAEDAEVTLEANPESADAGKLAGFRGAGINRLSLGIQSMLDEELRLLGRAHTAARARAAVTDARRAGFENVSVDLILGLPGQSPADSLASVEAVVALEPTHASLYLLELHPGADLVREAARAGLAPATDDDAADMYVAAMDRLQHAGLQQYEISNVARPGRESRHNLKYWTDGDWIGFGTAAHSTRHGVRWKNVAGTEEYISRIGSGRDPAAERLGLTVRQRVEEALFMGLRLAAGVDAGAVGRRYGVDVWDVYADRVAPFVDAGLLVIEDGRFRLTQRGMLLANEVMTAFV
jgi:oxygen-independent coproporphyrinogen-3 oxidase